MRVLFNMPTKHGGAKHWEDLQILPRVGDSIDLEEIFGIESYGRIANISRSDDFFGEVMTVYLTRDEDGLYYHLDLVLRDFMDDFEDA